jgi:transcriptional regulator with XRE-family HTH domain
MKKEHIDPVDLYVGRKIRELRHAANMGQTDLAAKIGVKYQQVQKYEVGLNRVSASMLYRIAKALRVPFGTFVEGYRDPVEP